VSRLFPGAKVRSKRIALRERQKQYKHTAAHSLLPHTPMKCWRRRIGGRDQCAV
jgi:hypothetical protein